MAYRVIARKWRPNVFQDVVAQDHIVQTLQNAIRSDRVVQAYLFCGPRGTGKTTMARLLAKAFNCENGPTPKPCGDCGFCTAIADNKSMDVLEIDGASNRGIDEIRQLREEVGFAATRGKRKVYIIDEVHMLTAEAFNALLKTLEEPPPHVVFVLATTEPHRMPETILSRCQRYNFRRISTEAIVGQLRKILDAEEVASEDEALFLLARKADGALRDAENLLDQSIAYTDGSVSAGAVRDLLGVIPADTFFELTQAMLDSDTVTALHKVGLVLDGGGDAGEFTQGLLEHVRHLLVARVSDGVSGDDLSEADQERYRETGALFREEDLLRMLQAVSDLEARLGRVSNPRFWLELTVLKLVKMAPSESVMEVMARLDRLEGLLRKGGTSGARQPGHEAPAGAGRDPGPATPQGPAGRTPSPELANEAKQAVVDAPPPAAPTGETEPAPADNLTFDDVRKKWPDLVEHVRLKKMTLGTFLSEGTPTALHDRRLDLVFKADKTFHVEQVRRNEAFLEEATADVLGVSLRVRCELDAAEADGATKESRAPADERVRMAIEVFDGEVVGR
ncbi:MAG: DNA polymerase III subunit gamma/tau [Gemmatimonadota bacterium]|nr:DNA polymerase III subunit gamma/tau [Gemmatimonadota bacterium]